jgi:hypothetical protein
MKMPTRNIVNCCLLQMGKALLNRGSTPMQTSIWAHTPALIMTSGFSSSKHYTLASPLIQLLTFNSVPASHSRHSRGMPFPSRFCLVQGFRPPMSAPSVLTGAPPLVIRKFSMSPLILHKKVTLPGPFQ